MTLVETGTQELHVFTKVESVVQGGGVQMGYAAAPTHTNVPCVVTQERPGWAQRDFGVDSKSAFRGLVDEGWPIGERDLIKIVAGLFNGTYLLVRDAIPILEHEETVLVLEETQERPDAA